jgi:hypothetical protein
LISESQFGAFTMTAFGDAIGNRTVAEQTGDENLFACEKAHETHPDNLKRANYTYAAASD